MSAPMSDSTCTCTMCGVDKPMEEFYARPQKRKKTEAVEEEDPAAAKDEFGYPHEQVEVDSPFGAFKVDKGMVETLQMIWGEGYRTYLSCENNEGKVWICFDHDDFKRLVKHAQSTDHRDFAIAGVLGETNGSLYEFLEQSDIRLSWQDDGHPDESNTYWIAGDDVYFDVSLRFDVKLHATFRKLFKRSHEGDDKFEDLLAEEEDDEEDEEDED